MSEKRNIRSTTIVAVQKDGRVAMAGDGQVSMGNSVVKGNARKVRTIYDGRIAVGFAGATADAFTLFERFEARIKEYSGDLMRSAVELAKEWRTDRMLRRLEAMLLVADKTRVLLISGTGDVLEPEHGVMAIGSGGNYALAAGRALLEHTDLSAREIAEQALTIAGDICVFTNAHITVEETLVKLEEGKLESLTPVQIVAALDKYIIGQEKAKKAVAIALRNRIRRQKLPEDLQEEIAPKNIIMIGPTGVGKTEIARRLARLTGAPFVKVEATKYTEVGYVGRDVESMVRDLMSTALAMVKDELREEVREKAEQRTEELLLDALLPGIGERDGNGERGGIGFSADKPVPQDGTVQETGAGSAGVGNSAVGGSGGSGGVSMHTRERFRTMLRDGKLEDREIEINISRPNNPAIEIFSGSNVEELDLNLGSLGNIFGGKKKKRRMNIRQAREYLLQEEMEKLVDTERAAELARDRIENTGIIFIDEIDKIATREGRSSGDVSREGVQRDILPIVEGSKINTKHGVVDTSHILFIAAGAFHMSKPADLIPELQGRFPLRVELEALEAEEFYRILTQPENALIKQYCALLETEGVSLDFQDDAIRELSRIAADVNSRTENIGARRLHTIMELLLEEVSFNAPDLAGQTIPVTVEYVRERLADVVEDQDLSRYIL